MPPSMAYRPVLAWSRATTFRTVRRRQRNNGRTSPTARQLDPEAKCWLPGVPRATYMGFPFQIVQTPTQVSILYEYGHALRNVFMNSPHPRGPIEFWMGDSRATWEGDTLVVDVVHFNDQTWFDRAGNHHSEQLHVVERYTPVDRNHINYEVDDRGSEGIHAALEDEHAAYRQIDRNMQLLEYRVLGVRRRVPAPASGAPRVAGIGVARSRIPSQGGTATWTERYRRDDSADVSGLVPRALLSRPQLLPRRPPSLRRRRTPPRYVCCPIPRPDRVSGGDVLIQRRHVPSGRERQTTCGFPERRGTSPRTSDPTTGGADDDRFLTGLAIGTNTVGAQLSRRSQKSRRDDRQSSERRSGFFRSPRAAVRLRDAQLQACLRRDAGASARRELLDRHRVDYLYRAAGGATQAARRSNAPVRRMSRR